MVKTFDSDDIAPASSKQRNAILDVILAWPRLELGLTYWISFAIGVRPSETGILLGTMDTKSKINKLRSLYIHRKDKEAADLLKRISKEHKDFSEIRNTIAHAMLLGSSKSKPDDVYFQTSQAVPDQHGLMVIKCFTVDNLREAHDFALERAVNIRDMLKKRGATFEQ